MGEKKTQTLGRIMAALLFAERVHITTQRLVPRYAEFVKDQTHKWKKKLGIMKSVLDEIVEHVGSDDVLVQGEYSHCKSVQGAHLSRLLLENLEVEYVVAHSSMTPDRIPLCLYETLEYIDMAECKKFGDKAGIGQIRIYPRFVKTNLGIEDKEAGLNPVNLTFARFRGVPCVVQMRPGDRNDDVVDMLFARKDAKLMLELEKLIRTEMDNNSFLKGWVAGVTAPGGRNLGFHVISDISQTLRADSFMQREVPLDFDLYTEKVQRLLRRDIPGFVDIQDWFCQHETDGRRAYLLEGPPGTGKSFLIKTIIKMMPADYTTIIVNHNHIESLNFLRAYPFLFPLLVIIEDIDLLLDQDHKKQVLLNFLDGITSPEKMITIMTSNHANTLTKAITERPGRVDRMIHVGPGDLSNRAAQLKSITKHIEWPKTPSADDIAEMTDGLTVAQLREVVRRAAIYTEKFTGELQGPALLAAAEEYMDEWSSKTS